MRRLVLVAVLVSAASAAAAQQPVPAGTGGVAALQRALDRLASGRRVLIIGAHPDDEDTELLAYLSRGLGADAAYLSLSRGEGGQNLIGPELGEALGLLRTGELGAARSVDGGRQFFTRAFDFGFSKTLDESLRLWPVDSVLADVVQVIRRFRPQVIVSVFSGTPRDGHGQHQESGVVARAAFDLLRDSAWGPRRLFRSARFDTGGTTVTLPSGDLDPVAGQSYHQLAMAGRSLHRSQDMGMIQGVGPSVTRLSLVTEQGADAQTPGRPGAVGLFEGIDTTLGPGMERYRVLIDSARALLSPRDPSRIVPLLAAATTELRRSAPPEVREAKEPLLAAALAAAAGVVVDAYADDAHLVAGQTVALTSVVWDAGTAPVGLERVVVNAPAGWTIAARPPAAGAAPVPDGGTVLPGSVATRRFGLAVSPDAPPTRPYFLARPRVGALYDWTGVPADLRGEPVDAPLVSARFTLSIGGVSVTLDREVVHRRSEQASGEVRKPLVVVPAIGVSVTPDVLVWPLGNTGSRTVTVELEHGSRERSSGVVRLDVPSGWPAVAPQPFALEGEGTRRAFTFAVRAPSGLAAGSYAIRAVAEADGRRHDVASVAVDYPHIRPAVYVTDATVRLEATALVLPRLRRVGYVRGASDRVPEALAAIGLPVVVLSAEDLVRGELSAYDVIVVGSRAYEIDPALVANNQRLLDYARAGGRLLVQYQQYPFIQGGFAPFRLTIARPHDRVTDETAPVRVLEPAHPAFRIPNVLTSADWDGWTQERGLYFAHDWDPAYLPLLETGDVGERLRGGLLVAPLGRGLYVYTGLAFFRQLPAGVPGAYRLFANLLGLRPENGTQTPRRTGGSPPR